MGATGLVEVDRAAQTHRLAASVWTEMRQHGIVPTPRNYDLWFNYRSGTNPALIQRIVRALEQGQALTPAVLDALYSEFLAGPEIDLDAIGAGTDAIQATTQVLVANVADHRAALTGYGDTLAHWTQHLGHDSSVGSLMRALVALTSETTRAAERNRVLEQQLSASAGRISKLRQSLAAVKQEATTDALTGIANRKAFEARLRRATLQTKTRSDLISVLLIDIDHFKRFNDTYGHKTGDLVLRLVARVLADNVKGRDCAARYGGEEFAVLLAGANLRAGCIVARQICEALSSKHLVNKVSGHGFGHVTVSIGVAQYRPGESAAALVERADLGLYRAKRAGRNRICVEAATDQVAA